MDRHSDPTREGRMRSDIRGSEREETPARPAGTESTLLTGMFRDRESAERAYNLTQERGYTQDDINLVMSKDTREKFFPDREGEEPIEKKSKAMEGTGAGSAIGGGLGAVAGIIAAVGTSVVIPGLGVVISGPIAAGLAGAGAGGIAGGVIGALVGAGIPRERAKVYESGVEEGRIVMSVKPKTEEDARYLENQWRANNGEEVHL